MKKSNDMHSPGIDEDEISLMDMLRPFWVKRKIITRLTLGFSAIALVIIIYLYLIPKPVHYYVTLKNITSETYPNGSTFVPTDLLDASVLDEIVKKYKLKNLNALRAALDVRYESLITDGIVESYKARLAVKNLTQSELTSINNQFIEDLNAANKSSLLISFSNSKLGLSNEMAKSILRDIPMIWSKQLATNKNILLKGSVAKVAVEKFENNSVKYALSLILKSEAIKNGLKQMADDSRLNSLRIDDLSVAEFQVDFDNYINLYLNPLKYYVYNDNNNLYVGIYKNNMRLDLDDVQRQVASYDKAVSSFKMDLGKEAGSGSARLESEGRSQLQLDQGGIEQIVKLVERSLDNNYLKELINKRIELEKRSSLIQKEISVSQYNNDKNFTVESLATAVMEKYTPFEKKYNRLVDLANAKLMEINSTFYSPIFGPKIIEGGLINKTHLSIFFGFSLLGLLLSIIYISITNKLDAFAQKDQEAGSSVGEKLEKPIGASKRPVPSTSESGKATTERVLEKPTAVSKKFPPTSA